MIQVLFLSVCVAYFSAVQGQSSCTTPSGGTGQCISIYQCESLVVLLNKPKRTPAEVDTLRRSHCGYQGNTLQVCCPVSRDECFTPEEQLGSCVDIYSCPNLASLLTPPVSKETTSFIQNSRCEGPNQYSVCCGAGPRPASVTASKVCRMSAAPPDPRTRCCGGDSETGDRIFGGNATAVDQYPWLTVIEYTKDSKTKLLCGGALISGKYVLTAGHCVVGPVLKYGTPTNVRLGEYDTANDGEDCTPVAGGGEDCTSGTTIIPIERVIPHHDYSPDNSLRRNDIALLRLVEVAPYTDFIRPICLPTRDWTINPPPNFILYAAGWGAINETTSSSNVKQHVDLPFRSLETCQPAYSVSKRNVALWKGQLCAGGEKGKDSCKGDSGGPLMYVNQEFKLWEVTGVVSFGPTPCGIEDIPGVYTNVYQYLPWIRSQIKP